MVAFNIVDDLDDRAVVFAGIVEHHRVTGFDDREPLPVGVHLGGESAEDGVLGVREDTQSAWRYALFVVL